MRPALFRKLALITSFAFPMIATASPASAFDAEVIDKLSEFIVADQGCDGHAYDSEKIKALQLELGELWGWEPSDVEAQAAQGVQQSTTRLRSEHDAFCQEVTFAKNNLSYGALQAIGASD